MGGAGLAYNLTGANRQQGPWATGGQPRLHVQWVHTCALGTRSACLPAPGHGGSWDVRAEVAVQCSVGDVLKVLGLYMELGF